MESFQVNDYYFTSIADDVKNNTSYFCFFMLGFHQCGNAIALCDRIFELCDSKIIPQMSFSEICPN